jgi:sec-independent protein translocase protein TatA
MLGLDNPLHIAFVLVLVLLVFGAKRLPEMGRSLGEGLRGFKESIGGERPHAHLTEAHAGDPAQADERPSSDSTPEPLTAEQPAERSSMQPVA